MSYSINQDFVNNYKLLKSKSNQSLQLIDILTTQVVQLQEKLTQATNLKFTRTIDGLTIQEKEEVTDAAAAVVIWKQLKERSNPNATPERVKETVKRYEDLCLKYRIEPVEPKVN